MIFAYKIDVNNFCPICGSNKVVEKNKHFFSYLSCKKCNHEYMKIKETSSTKLVNKIIKNNNIKQGVNDVLENVLEYSFCPYWAIAKNYKDINSIKISKIKKEGSLHFFSSKSIEIFSKNLLIPYSIIEEKESVIISLQK